MNCRRRGSDSSSDAGISPWFIPCLYPSSVASSSVLLFFIIYRARFSVFFSASPALFTMKERNNEKVSCLLIECICVWGWERERIVVYWPNPMKRMKLTVYKVNIVTRYTAPPLILWFFKNSLALYINSINTHTPSLLQTVTNTGNYNESIPNRIANDRKKCVLIDDD